MFRKVLEGESKNMRHENGCRLDGLNPTGFMTPSFEAFFTSAGGQQKDCELKCVG